MLGRGLNWGFGGWRQTKAFLGSCSVRTPEEKTPKDLSVLRIQFPQSPENLPLSLAWGLLPSVQITYLELFFSCFFFFFLTWNFKALLS